MKKFLIVVGLVLGLSAGAQNFITQSFINAQSLAVSNTICVTNLVSLNGTGTNVNGTQWTNFAGTRVVAGPTYVTNSITGAITTNASKANLLREIELRPDRNGNYDALTWVPVYTNVLDNWIPSKYNLNIRLTGQSGANSAVTFVFTPICDGTNESSAAADLWKVAVTATTTTPVVLNTNVPAYLWRGCKGIRLREIYNADTDASSRVDVLSCTLNSWTP